MALFPICPQIPNPPLIPSGLTNVGYLKNLLKTFSENSIPFLDLLQPGSP